MGMSPRPQIDHIRRPQILGAAAEVIAERGLGSTRIADVADRAGTSAPAILYWFDSKEELLSEALTDEEERFALELRKRLKATKSPSERLVILVAASTGSPSSGASDWRLWMELWTRALRDEGAGGTRAELDRRWRAEIAAIVADGQGSGEFAGDDPDETAAELAALIDGLAVQNTLGDPEMPDERMSAIVIRAAERMLGCELPEARPIKEEIDRGGLK
jgi:AcrR family transcriptional regulator